MFNKLKELTKDTAVYGISTMVGRFLTFLLVPFYTNVFLPAEYGVIGNLYIFIAIFNIFLLYGMDAAYLKFAGMSKNVDENDLFSTPYLSVFLVSLIISVAIILFKTPIYVALVVPASYYNLIYLVASILFVDSLCVIPFIKLRLQRKAKKFVFFKLTNIIVNVSLNLFLILKLKWGIEAVFVSNLAASFVAFLLLSPTIIKSLKFKIQINLLKKLLRFGLPYFPAGLAGMLIQGIDRPILTYLTDLRTSGIYNANYKLGIFMMLFVNMFQYAWQPFFLQNASEKNAKEIFSKVLTYFTLIAAGILIVISLFIDNIVQIPIYQGHAIINPLYWSGLNIVPIILLGYMFNGMYQIFSAGIFIKEKSIYVPIITSIGAIVNIALNFLLIPLIGITGAAFATLASYLVMAIGYFAVTQKFYKINYEYDKIGKIFLSVFIVGIIYYTQLIGGHLNLGNKFLMLLLFVILLGILKIGKEEISFLKKRLLKKRT